MTSLGYPPIRPQMVYSGVAEDVSQKASLFQKYFLRINPAATVVGIYLPT
ncbi:hypothetical protein [uncultured Sunxiuqinia sp.]